MMHKRIPRSAALGFTLIELSIVLVIIGLLVGGVLVGKDLIHAAEIRSTISQLEKYKTAFYTFKTKYNGMPGDFPAANAARFGFTVRSGAAGHGNGNGLVEACGLNTNIHFGCETALFWKDLSDASLIDGSFPLASDSLIQINPGQQSSYLPNAKIGKGNSIAVISDAGLLQNGTSGNGFVIAGIVSTDAGGLITDATLLTPNEANAIDVKIDDGKPKSGIAIFGDGSGTGAGFLAQGLLPDLANPITTCAVMLAPYIDPNLSRYATATAAGDEPWCYLTTMF
jgi:prepilin-type N-terminal cleavage/methylation domain-containing protein